MLQQSRIVSRDLVVARRFYAATARPLGLAIVDTREDGFALGRLSDMSNPVLEVGRPDTGDDHHVQEPAEDPAWQPSIYRVLS